MKLPSLLSKLCHLGSMTGCVAVDLLRFLSLMVRSRSTLAARAMIAEKQLTMFLEREAKPRRATAGERISLASLTRLLPLWRNLLVIVEPDTVCRWHRELGSWLWRRRSHRGGRPPLPHEIRKVIGTIHRENPHWSPRRIRDEARLKLDVKVAEATVKKYLSVEEHSPRHHTGQHWATFIRNHATEVVACDLFTVWTARFHVIHALVIMEVGSRRILHTNVTTGPTAAWVVQQLRETIPDLHSWRFLVHDRDSIFNRDVDAAARHMGLRVLKTPPQAPQANSFCERIIGTIRRECLDHLIVLSERHLRRILRRYATHYNHARPHMSLGPGIPDPPEGLPVEVDPERHALPEGCRVVSTPVLGGLHHEYRLEKTAA